MAGPRLTPNDINGVWAIMPTPAKANASDWRCENSVDLDETARVVDALIRAGVDGILSLGTLGECATLDRAEKRAFMGAVVESAKGRVPCFGGTTTLNTRDTISETRTLLDVGLDGTMLGVPMWCQPDVPTAVQFYRDVAEACPGVSICVYANFEAFKFLFPRPFWAQVAQIPQVVCAKYLGVATLEADLRMVAGKVRLLPNDGNYYAAARIAPEQITGFWSGGALCGPAVSTKLRDDVAAAKTSHDWSAAKSLSDSIAVASASLFPQGSFTEFSKYNIPLEKARMNAAGWAKAGPCRPPYSFAPADYIAGAERSGRLLAELHEDSREASASMMRAIDYFFDIVSPFSYLAWQRLPELAQRHGCELRTHVVDIAALKLLAGNTGPSNRAIPNKTRYLQFDKKRWAARYGAPIVNPKSYDCARVNRGFLFAEDEARRHEYLDACWRRIWGEGGDPTHEDLLSDVARALGWNAAEFLIFTETAEAHARYEAATRAADERKVFGVPTMIVDDEMYWGNDRLEFLEDYLIASTK